MSGLIRNGVLLTCAAIAAAWGWWVIGQSRSQELETNPQDRWDNSRLWGSPDPGPKYEVARAYSGVSFNEPVGMALAPGSIRLFVYERGGRLYSFEDSPQARAGNLVKPDLCLDVRDLGTTTREIYGVAFAPNFADSREVYICYVAEPDVEGGTHVCRFRVAQGEPPRIEIESKELLISFRSGGHNGGCLRFGPDGYLYISTGDAGPASPPDPLMTGQDNRDLLASILRIDVSRRTDSLPYAIPDDNPFVNQADVRPEIWAYGLRNPWKMSFDSRSGDLWVGDVGWELWEMIYRIVPGGNYGWRIREGHQVIHPNDTVGPTPIRAPTVVHSHRESRSITGGYVYLGNKLPELRGHYVYADYETGKVWSFRFSDGLVKEASELADSELKVVAFGLNQQRELLLVDFRGGLYELQPKTHSNYNPDFPKRLSETGLFIDVQHQTEAPGVHAYELTAEPWMDGLMAKRWIAIPSEEVPVTVGQGIRFPEGTVFVKTIVWPHQTSRSTDPNEIGRPIETQILLLSNGAWQGYTYLWNAEGTDAELVPSEGMQLDFPMPDDSPEWLESAESFRWTVASRAECLVCHTTFLPEMGVLGYEPIQLDKVVALDGRDESQLPKLQSRGLLPTDDSNAARLVDPYDSKAELEARARSYLHVNCRHCHRDGGGGGSTMKLEYHRPLDQLDLVSWKAQHGDFGLPGGQRIAEGAPQDSVLLMRMAKVGRGHMPYKGSELVDRQGVALIAAWIESMPSDSKDNTGRVTQGLPEISRVESQLQSEADALRIALQVHALPSTDQRSQWGMLAGETENPTIRDLLDGLVPFQGSGRTLGAEFDEADVLAVNGDPARGRELFFSSYFQCSRCHRVGGEGGLVGPDLSIVAAEQTKQDVFNSLKRPSEKLTQGYETSLIELADGSIVSVRVLSQTETELQVGTSEGKTVSIPVDEIREIRQSPVSLMPDDLVSHMSAEQLSDLLAFLETLK